MRGSGVGGPREAGISDGQHVEFRRADERESEQTHDLAETAAGGEEEGEVGMPFKSVKGVMDEWKAGTLHSGSPRGPVVTNQQQAVAIALSEQRKAKQGGERVPGSGHMRHHLSQVRKLTLPKKGRS